MKELIMAYQGEMALKGLNRGTFEAALARNMRYRLKEAGPFRVYKAQSCMFAQPLDDSCDIDAAFDRLQKVFGVVKLSRSAVCEKDFDVICRTAAAYLEQPLRAAKTFKVEAKRSDKSFPMNSPALCRELGGYLLSRYPHLRVKVKEPDLVVMVEIRDFGAYIHGPKQEAAGGLPVGTSGRALNLLSGGLDSPVAAWYMARRGLALHHIHFASPPYTGERAKQKVVQLAGLISEYTGSCILYVVPYTRAQEYIRDHAPQPLFTVLMRRSMMRIAGVIGREIGVQALITGESLAQVASQTAWALGCTDCAQDLPVLRPLIGLDKSEIIAAARRIGTYDTSILPYEDCCTIFTPPHPKTRPALQEILEAEDGMPELAALEAEAARDVERIRVRMGQAAAEEEI